MNEHKFLVSRQAQAANLNGKDLVIIVKCSLSVEEGLLGGQPANSILRGHTNNSLCES